jgi:hypothetical protein
MKTDKDGGDVPSETSVHFCRTTRRCMPGDRSLKCTSIDTDMMTAQHRDCVGEFCVPQLIIIV